MNEYLSLVTDVGFPIVAALVGGYFVFLTLNFILTGVLDDIKQQRMFAIALDNRVKTMNNEIVRIDVKMCQAFGIAPDMAVLHEQTDNLMQEKTKENNMNMKFVIIAVAVIGFVALMIWGVEATMCKEALNCVAK